MAEKIVAHTQSANLLGTRARGQQPSRISAVFDGEYALAKLDGALVLPLQVKSQGRLVERVRIVWRKTDEVEQYGSREFALVACP